MSDETVEVAIHTQADGTQVVALMFPNMPIAVKEGDTPVSGVALSAEEAKVLARMLLEKATEIE